MTDNAKEIFPFKLPISRANLEDAREVNLDAAVTVKTVYLPGKTIPLKTDFRPIPQMDVQQENGEVVLVDEASEVKVESGDPKEPELEGSSATINVESSENELSESGSLSDLNPTVMQIHPSSLEETSGQVAIAEKDDQQTTLDLDIF